MFSLVPGWGWAGGDHIPRKSRGWRRQGLTSAKSPLFLCILGSSPKRVLSSTPVPFVSSSQWHLMGGFSISGRNFSKFSLLQKTVYSVFLGLSHIQEGLHALKLLFVFLLFKVSLLQKKGEGRRKSAPSSLWDRKSLQALAFLPPTRCNLTLWFLTPPRTSPSPIPQKPGNGNSEKSKLLSKERGP